MLVTCQECGKEVSDTAESCIGCGAKKEAYLGRERACFECGEMVTEARAQCLKCGAVQSLAPQEALHDTSQPISEVDDYSYSEIEPNLDRGRRAAGLWARFVAKGVDVTVFFIPALVPLIFLIIAAGTVSGTNYYESPSQGSDYFWGAIFMLSLAIIEGTIISMFGTTPGKILMGIRVRNFDGTRLNFGVSLWRSIRALIQGQGAGIPIIALITHFVAYDYVKKNGVTGWDKGANATYLSTRVSGFRWFIGIAFYLVAMVLLIVLTAIGTADSYY